MTAHPPPLWPWGSLDAAPAHDDWTEATGFESAAELADLRGRAVALADAAGEAQTVVCLGLAGDGDAVVFGPGPYGLGSWRVPAARIVAWLPGLRLMLRPDWLYPRLLPDAEWAEEERVLALERPLTLAEEALYAQDVELTDATPQVTDATPQVTEAAPDPLAALPERLRAAYQGLPAPPTPTAWEALPVAWVRHSRDPECIQTSTPWPKLAARLQTAGAIEAPTADDAKRRCPGWLPVRLAEGQTRRKNGNVAQVWALVCDLDDASLDVLCDAARGLRHVWHTTIRHHPTAPKARLVLPLRRPVDARDWPAVWAAGARWAGARGLSVDPACKDPSRLYYLPAVWVGGTDEVPAFAHGCDLHARPLCPDELLRDYPEPVIAAWTYASAPTAAPPDVQRGRAARGAARALSTIADRIKGAGAGQRRRVMFDLAFFAGAKLVGPLPRAEVEAAILAAAATHQDLRDGERHVRRGIEAGIAAAGTG